MQNATPRKNCTEHFRYGESEGSCKLFYMSYDFCMTLLLPAELNGKRGKKVMVAMRSSDWRRVRFCRVVWCNTMPRKKLIKKSFNFIKRV